MKHLLLLLFSSFFVTSLMAQEKDGIYFSNETTVKPHRVSSVSFVDTLSFNHMDANTKLQYQLDYVRYCLYKSNRQKSYGYAFSIVGGLVMGIGMADDSDNVNEYGNRSNNSFDGTYVLTIVGGVMSLAGTIMVIDSEKWLKRAYIGPNGVGVKFEF
ncbi:MAG TPA: hypothetical protein VFG54_03705 [Prolixibacteraceae bacterium]|nr:hypothetical protein [Prolixibacteraceae bacterium]